MKPAGENKNRTGTSSPMKNTGKYPMSDRYTGSGAKKIIFDRMVFCVFGVILVVFLAVLFWIIAVDSGYRAVLDHVEAASCDVNCETVPAVVQPDDAYFVSEITFGGTCTPASMLGSSSYGTFNLMYAENGAEYFFGKLGGIFGGDDSTVVGCSAVFSDNAELEPAQKGNAEWYRAPAGASDVFAEGGVDAVSLECARSGDYGESGITDTKNSLDACAVEWGSSDRNIVIDLADGIEAVVCCFTYTEGCEDDVIPRIQTAAQEYDIVLLYITDTYDSYTVTDAKRAAYRSFADAGADAVIGSNGAKLQCIEEWNGVTIAYSLGALLDGSTKYPEKYSALLSVKISAEDGAVVDVSCSAVPVVTYDENHSWRPDVIGEGAERENVLSFLNGERETPNE